MFVETGFWGRAWYDHLERSYPSPELLEPARQHVERGALADLKFRRGSVIASVAAEKGQRVELDIRPLARPRWNALREVCARRLWFRWELVQGTPEAFRRAVIRVGMFPSPADITFRCACLDRRYGICEHAAAALYGVGTRLDWSPETLFELRGVDLDRLATGDRLGLPQSTAGASLDLNADGLGDLFGVAVEPEPDADADLAVLDELSAADDRQPLRPPRTLFGGG